MLFVDNSSVQTLTHTIVDYNDWYTQNNTDTIVALWTNSSLNIWTQPQFAAYQTANNEDAHSFMADPLFVNADSNNYHLTVASPCIGTGINTGLGNDLDLYTRPLTGPYDVGAYQYEPTGIQETGFANTLISIYPNPGNGNFMIEGAQPGMVIEVYNSIGDTVYRTTIRNTVQAIDISLQPSGIYMVNLSQKGQAIAKQEIILAR